MIKVIEWLENKLIILDQTKLPWEEVYLELSQPSVIAQAIKEMRVRGAPVIGLAAAYGIALGAQSINAEKKPEFLAELSQLEMLFSSTRPTAVNLFKAIERMRKRALKGETVIQIKADLIDEAIKIHHQEIEATRLLSQCGAELIKDGSTLITHCNAGSLATAGYGTALGVIKMAKEQGKKIEVMATETRPLLQGARLTAWELVQENIPVTLITDSMAGYFINQGKVDCIIVGADRVAANGDFANKIGTYSLAVLAKENHIPFYVAAPTSTIDSSIRNGSEIPIEERNQEEVIFIESKSIAPSGIKAANPAFDVTPRNYVSALITEKGIIYQPDEEKIQEAES
jgi:methylthioribose-1-phosphate isomerase